MKGQAGVTLTELMITTALIGLVVLVGINSFDSIQKAIQNSKAKTLATNLAQEKLQILKQSSYSRLLVTTSTAWITAFEPDVPYDIGSYPPESILEGSIRFQRLTYVQVAQEDSGNIQLLPDTTPDTGMKLVTVTVTWLADGELKKVQLRGIDSNPQTVMSISMLNGQVRNAATGTGLANAVMTVAENIGWRDTSNGTGNYTINLSPGNYTAVASADGFYTRLIPFSIAANATQTLNVDLTAISSGTLRGAVWISDHLLISQVVASTGPSGGHEYVELYNPTTGPLLMGDNAAYNAPPTWMHVWDAAGNSQQRQLVYISTVVPSRSYFLISNTGDGGGPAAATSCAPLTIGGVNVQPDACWRYVGTPSHALQCNPASTGGCAGGPNAGGVAVGTNGGLPWSTLSNFTKYDSIAWSGTGSTPAYPTETSAKTPSIGTGLQAGEQFVRRTDTGSVINTGYGNAYDANVSSMDFISIVPMTVIPRSTTTTLSPISGTPAIGTLVSVTDGLSAGSTAYAAGSPLYAEFRLPDVATGTWTVFISSSGRFLQLDNVPVAANTTTNIPHGSTTPGWPAVGHHASILSAQAVSGYISGRVINAANSVISPFITVSAIGGDSKTTTASGSYLLTVPAGSYTVSANPNNANGTYVSQDVTVNVDLGEVTNGVDFVLSQGGKIYGYTTRDGVNALTGIVVTATNANDIVVDQSLSGGNGLYNLVNLSTGVYEVKPILESGESSTPESTTVTVTAGSSVNAGTFTIRGAYGVVTGAVRRSGSPIQTGALIIITTGTIGGTPPALSTSTLTSAPYYAGSSTEDGSYRMEVRGSTTTTYRVYGYSWTFSGQTPVTSTGVITNVSIIPGQTTSGVNFSW